MQGGISAATRLAMKAPAVSALRALLPLAALILAASLSGCEQGKQAPADKSAEAAAPGTIDRSHKGSQLPDFTVKDRSGKELKLASLKGKPFLINLWATWCGPCVAELPQLDRLGAKLRVVTISQDLGNPDKVEAFLKARGGTRLQAWLDPENELAFHYEAQTLPTTIYYDAEGREVWRLSGAHDWDSAETAEWLAEAK